MNASSGEWCGIEEMDKYIVIVGDMVERLSNGKEDMAVIHNDFKACFATRFF